MENQPLTGYLMRYHYIALEYPFPIMTNHDQLGCYYADVVDDMIDDFNETKMTELKGEIVSTYAQIIHSNLCYYSGVTSWTVSAIDDCDSETLNDYLLMKNKMV